MSTNKKTKKYAQQIPPAAKQQLSQPTQQQQPQFQLNKTYNVVSILKSGTHLNVQQQQQQQHQHLNHQQSSQPHHHHQLHHQQSQQQTYSNAVNRSVTPSATATVICSGGSVLTVNSCQLTTGELNSTTMYGLNHRGLQGGGGSVAGTIANNSALDTNGRFTSSADICNGVTSSTVATVSSSNNNGSGSGSCNGGGILTLTNSHGSNAVGITLGTPSGAYIHDKGLIGVSVGCVENRKYDFKNNNLLANSNYQTTTQEYVSGNNNSGNAPRTNPQTAGIYRGPPPPNPASRGTGSSARHVHLQTMYQPTMHQNVILPTYSQFTPRQPTFPAPQFQYAHGPITTYYPYTYLSTIQQQQTHQRSGVNVNTAIGNTMPVQPGPNGPIAGPSASQPQLPLPAGTVLAGAVQTGASAVFGVGTAGAGQVPPLVGVMQANVPTQPAQGTKRHRHRLQIIDPETKKNILEEYNEQNSNNETDYQQLEPLMQVPSVAQPEIPIGITLMGSDSPSSMPYNIADLNQLPTQRTDILMSQTPVVSAMTDAPSVEILPTPQKPRSKKTPIVPPKEDTTLTESGHSSIIQTDNSLSTQSESKPVTETEISTNPEFISPQVQTPIQTQQQSQPQSQSQQLLSAEQLQQKEHNQQLLDIVETSRDQPSIASETEVKNNEKIVENLATSDTTANIKSTEPIASDQVNELSNTLETKLPAVHNELQREPNETAPGILIPNGSKPETSQETTTTAHTVVTCVNTSCPTDVFENDQNINIVDKIHSEETDRVTEQPMQELENTSISMPLDDETVNVINNVKDQDEECKQLGESAESIAESSAAISEEVKIEPKIQEPAIQWLINYAEGQWSPKNPTGIKHYNREQLLQLREAKASHMRPDVSNVSILPQPNLMPSFMRNNNHKRVQSMVGAIGGNRSSDGIGSGGNNYISKQASMSGVQGRGSMKGGMIHVNLSLNQDVKLNETENAWRPRIFVKCDSTSDPDAISKREKDELVRRVRGILNKLTPEKFNTLVEEIIKLKIDTLDKMNEVIVLVFEKAIDEPNFSVSYAELCQRLIMEVKARDERMESGTKSNLAHFRNALIDKTEREFKHNVSQSTAKANKLQPIVDKIKKCTNLNEKAELEALFEEEERKIRRRSGGTVRFIGELFKISMLTGKIINSCIDTLLNPQSEDMLECLCKLLTTVGAKFEQTCINPQEKTRCYSLEKPIAKMQAIAKDKEGTKISSRVRFMLQDVIDLRENKWQSTRNEAPKTMDQIEKETKNEQLSAQYSNYNVTMYNTGTNGPQGGTNAKRDDRGNRYGDNRSGYGGSHSQRGEIGSLRRQQQNVGSSCNNNHVNGNNNDDNTWHVQTSKGSRVLDTNKLEGLLNPNLAKKMGGVAQFLWNNNASRQSTIPTTNPSNSFAVLSSIIDKSITDRDHERDRTGPRNKGSFNKGSMERERYNDRVLHSRTGSAQGSRENSSSRGVQQGRGNSMNPPSLQKSASHSKYTQQMPSSRLTGKTLTPSAPGAGLYRNDQQQQTNASQSSQNAKLAVTFIEPNGEDIKLIKLVILEMIELSVANKSVTPTAVSYIKRIPESQRCGFLYYILTDYLHLAEVGKFYRRYLALIVTNSIQQEHLSVEHFKLAYKEFCECVNDLIVDIPELWLYIIQFTGPLIVKNILSVSDLWNKQLKDNSPPSMGKKFLKAYLTYCTREVGPNFTRNMWKKFNMKWTDYVPDKDVIDFIESNKLEYVENDTIALPKFEVREAHEKYIKNIMEHIEHLLKEGADANSIFDYCNGNIKDVDKLFIRSLTKTLCNFAIACEDSCKLDTEIFQRVCIPVFQRYINSNEDELECLYSMQLLVHSLEHPRALLNDLFGELYDSDIIPRESFIKWRDSKDQSAGKGVAVKGLNPFFNHVLSNETSDENN